MRKFSFLPDDIDKRIKQAIKDSVNIFINKFAFGIIEAELEAGFQHELALILDDVLKLKMIHDDEFYKILLEHSYSINNKNDYVDIAIKYSRGKINKEYLIELKYKNDSDPSDLANLETYYDLYDLDVLKNTHNPGHVQDCYVVFLTDIRAVTISPKGKNNTRTKVPMHDGYTILPGIKYMPVQKTAKNKVIKRYGNQFQGFVFKNAIHIQYTKFKNRGKDNWFFIAKI